MEAGGLSGTLLLCVWLLIADCSSAEDYVLEGKAECHHMNGTERVRFLRRYFYNGEEFLYYDSDVGKFIAKTELGRFQADYFNSDKEIMEYQKSAVQTFCVYNYNIFHSVTADRRVEPQVKVSVMGPEDDLLQHQHTLICNVHGFFPSEISVKWFRNDQEQSESVKSSDLFPNGDWTFQILVMLETDIQRGDSFTCEVLHKSLRSPLRVHWKPEVSDSAKNKMVTGIVGFVLGGIFITVGLVIYWRSQKARSLQRGNYSHPLNPSETH
ncbi:H-2 class II histocompatibility antigen, E-S beta chain-like [Spea bombifrons]|uniref:H-2 class II histocompatibility antigen, E-S beta chain-like n=1 Tax=Spea bombifrons TaxID=233779 RepID=UPI0023492571|nr:H-2 class II histocompatibility antigen, E-S beta chain-like [Spea bombifrons]